MYICNSKRLDQPLHCTEIQLHVYFKLLDDCMFFHSNKVLVNFKHCPAAVTLQKGQSQTLD